MGDLEVKAPSTNNKRPASTVQDATNLCDLMTDAKNDKKPKISNLGHDSTEGEPNDQTPDPEKIEIKITFGKNSKTVCRLLDSTIADLKNEIFREIGIPVSNQKLLFKTKLDDASTLRNTTLKNGSKIMVMGSKPEDHVKAHGQSTTPDKDVADWGDETLKLEPWSQKSPHDKIVAKGVPEDALPGIPGRQLPLQEMGCLPGLLNSQGTKVRLTFKPDIHQIWIGSPSHTQKIPYQRISKIEGQPVAGNEGYSIVRLQLGAVTTSNYWLYFVPSQYVAAIKVRIAGFQSLLE